MKITATVIVSIELNNGEQYTHGYTYVGTGGDNPAFTRAMAAEGVYEAATELLDSSFSRSKSVSGGSWSFWPHPDANSSVGFKRNLVKK